MPKAKKKPKKLPKSATTYKPMKVKPAKRGGKIKLGKKKK